MAVNNIVGASGTMSFATPIPGISVLVSVGGLKDGTFFISTAIALTTGIDSFKPLSAEVIVSKPEITFEDFKSAFTGNGLGQGFSSIGSIGKIYGIDGAPIGHTFGVSGDAFSVTYGSVGITITDADISALFNSIVAIPDVVQWAANSNNPAANFIINGIPDLSIDSDKTNHPLAAGVNVFEGQKFDNDGNLQEQTAITSAGSTTMLFGGAAIAAGLIDPNSGIANPALLGLEVFSGATLQIDKNSNQVIVKAAVETVGGTRVVREIDTSTNDVQDPAHNGWKFTDTTTDAQNHVVAEAVTDDDGSIETEKYAYTPDQVQHLIEKEMLTAEGELVDTKYTYDAAGVQTDADTTVTVPNKSTDGGVSSTSSTPIIGGQIGAVFGSSIGQALGGNNPFAKLAAGSALSAIGKTFGQSLDLYFNDTTGSVSFESAVGSSLNSLGGNLGSALLSQATGMVSGFLVAELDKLLGVDTSTLGGKLINLGGTTVVNQALTNITNGVALTTGLDGVALGANFINAIGEVANDNVPSTHESGARGSVGSAWRIAA